MMAQMVKKVIKGTKVIKEIREIKATKESKAFKVFKVSGVYLGSDTPPDGVNVWIDPTGEVSTFEMSATFADGTTQTFLIYGEVAE